MSDFTAVEFADYWEGKHKDDLLAIDWIALKIQSEAGIETLAQTADLLAERHGVSSPEVKSFRAFISKAYDKINKQLEEAGFDTHVKQSFKFAKNKDTGEKRAKFSVPLRGGRKADPYKTARRQIDKWWSNWSEQGFSDSQIRDKINKAFIEVCDDHLV